MSMVVYWCEHLRDGVEEGSKIVADVGEAEVLVKQLTKGVGWCNTTFRLFKLGDEIHIRVDRIEEPQPAKLTGVKITINDGKQ